MQRGGARPILSRGESDLSEGGERDNVIRVGFGVDGKLTRDPDPRTRAVTADPASTESARRPLHGQRSCTALFGFKPARLRYWQSLGAARARPHASTGATTTAFKTWSACARPKVCLIEGVPLQQVRASVESLRREFPRDHQPTRGAAGHRRRPERRRSGRRRGPTSLRPGQAVLDFSVDGLESDVVRLLALRS